MATVSPLQNRGDIFIFMGLTDFLTIAKVLTQDVWSSQHLCDPAPGFCLTQNQGLLFSLCGFSLSVCLTLVVLGIHPRALSC